MDPIILRKSLAEAIFELKSAAGASYYEPLRLKMRHAYQYLETQIQEIDRDVFDALEDGAA